MLRRAASGGLRALQAARPQQQRAPLLQHRGAAALLGSRCFSDAAAPSKVQKLCDEVCQLNVLELKEFVEMFKSKAGLSDADMAGGMAMPAGMMMGAGPAAGPAAAEEEAAPAAPVKEYFDIKLVSFNPANKIKVIKEIRQKRRPTEHTSNFEKDGRRNSSKSRPLHASPLGALTGLGLKEAKDVVEGAPAIVKKDVKKDEGEEIIAKLKEIEAVAELD